MTIKMYEKYGAGTVIESSEVNWKMDSDPSHLYYFYPIKRPIAKKDIESDLTNSMSKCNYFRVTGATKIVDPRIIVCSSVKTSIVYVLGDRVSDTVTEFNPRIIYGGSGYSNGLEFDASVGVKVTLENGVEKSYAVQHEYIEDTSTQKWLQDHLFISDKICIRINLITGSGVKLRFADGFDSTNTSLAYAGSGGTPGLETSGNLKAAKTYLYAGLSNSYVAPTSNHLHNLKFVTNGNMTFDVPMSTTPELATGSSVGEYSGADLYTPYINTQLRVASSTFDDVGNSPEYRLVFTCKIFN